MSLRFDTYPTSAAQEAAQNDALGSATAANPASAIGLTTPRPYADVSTIESSAPSSDSYIYCVANKTVYEKIAVGSFTVNHTTILTCFDSVLYVWKSMDGLLGPNTPIFTDSTEPAAGDCANLTWWNSDRKLLRVSNGVVIIDVPIVSPSVQDGKLAMLPARTTVTGDTSQALTQANTTRLRESWVAPIDRAFRYISVRLPAIAASGNLSWLFEDATVSASPVTIASGTISSVDTTAKWVRIDLGASRQTYYGRTYRLTLWVAEATTSISLGYGRQLPAQDSGLVVNCWAEISTNGGSNYSALQQNSRNAQIEIVVDSTANHSPQLLFGRCGLGKHIALYTGSFWELKEIPIEGLALNCESLTAIDLTSLETILASPYYKVFVYDNSGSLAIEAANVDRTTQDGVYCKSGALTYREVGLVSGVTRIGSYVAPIRCRSINTFCNLNNTQYVEIFRQPYAANTSKALSSGTWERYNNNDDFRIINLSYDSNVTAEAVLGYNNGSWIMISLGIDGYPTPSADAPVASVTGYSNGSTIKRSYYLKEGLHVFYALNGGNTGGAPNHYYYYNSENAIAYNGVIAQG